MTHDEVLQSILCNPAAFLKDSQIVIYRTDDLDHNKLSAKVSSASLAELLGALRSYYLVVDRRPSANKLAVSLGNVAGLMGFTKAERRSYDWNYAIFHNERLSSPSL